MISYDFIFTVGYLYDRGYKLESLKLSTVFCTRTTKGHERRNTWALE